MKFRSEPRLCAPSLAHLPIKPVALAVALALAAPPPVLAGPTGADVVSGQARVTQPDAQTTLIRQSSDKAIINWHSFSIAPGQSVRFQQPGSNSVALNRVTTPTPSDIQGSLSANGKIFLINPSGILFGKNASVDVGGLVASTLDIRNEDFLAGRYHFAKGDGGSAVRNQGRLSAAERGTIALLGAEVSNEGTMSARLGTVGLAAGGKVSLDFAGDGLTRIVVDAASINALVENGGAMLAEGGQVIMSARALGALADTVVRHQGVIEARSLVERNGRIVLDGGTSGKLELTGTLDASGLERGQRGGAVTVAGNELHVASGAVIDVRGTEAGGTAHVGGGERGTDPSIQHASSVTMDSGSSILADALNGGDGGRIVLWSDGALAAHGSLSARAGAQSGDGGFIETSGKTVSMTGLRANASSAKGKAGTWLLDPEYLYIGPEEAGTISDVLTSGTNSTSTATRDITVAANIIKRVQDPMDGEVLAPTDATLFLEAGENIIMYGGPTIRSDSGKLHVDFNANAAGKTNGVQGTGAIVIDSGTTIRTNGGDIWLYGQSDQKQGYATGTSLHEAGIYISNSLLDTRVGDSAIAGTITMRGRGSRAGSMEDKIGGTGIHLVTSTLRSGSGDIDIEGRGGTGPSAQTANTFSVGDNGVGVNLDLSYGGEISTSTGTIDIFGATPRWSAPEITSYVVHSDGAIGILATLGTTASITSTQGAVRLTGASLGIKPGVSHGVGTFLRLQGGKIAGRSVSVHGTALDGAANGIEIISPTLSNSPVISATNFLSIFGDGDSGYGLSLKNVNGTGETIEFSGQSKTSSGILFENAVVGEPDKTDRISMQAFTAASSAPMLSYSANNKLSSMRADRINIVPGFGQGIPQAAQLDTPIYVRDELLNAPGFNVSFSQLGIGRFGNSHVVVGSSGHRGAIQFKDATHFVGDLTLQNGGAGSQGITLDRGTSVSGRLTLSSGGKVMLREDDGDALGIKASSLLLHGPQPESSFQLSSTINQVSQFSALLNSSAVSGNSESGDVNFSNAGALRIITPQNFDIGVSGTSGMRVAGDLTIETSGNLTLAADVSAPNGTATLVSRGIFLNEGNNTLATSTNGWRVFADTWVGEVRGPLAPSQPYPNYYGCTYRSDCGAEINGNRFIYRERPVLTLTPIAQEREYGSNSDPSFTNRGLVNGDTLNDALIGSYATTDPRAPVGTYETSGTFTSPVGYEIVAPPGSLTITPATLLVRVDDKDKIYGATEPLLTASLSGFRFEDTAALVSGLTLSTASGAAATAGTHPILGANAQATNYRFVYQPGTLTVDRAPLQVIVADKVKVYGGPEPTLSVTYSGFRYGDTESVVSGLQLSTATGAAASAGTHAITGADAAAANYRIAYQSGVLTVDKALLQVIVADEEKTYGAPEPTLSAAYSGFRYGDTESVVSGLQLSTATGKAASAGTHTIIGADATAANYGIVYQHGVLTVDKAPLQVVIADKAKTYGDADPLLTASFSGLIYDDGASDIIGLVLSTATGASATAGTHAITGSEGSAANYTMTSRPGTLTVNKAPLLVIADDKQKVYGDPEPAFTASASGLKYSDTAAVVRGLAVVAPAGAEASAGRHAVAMSNGSADNYTLNYQPGILSVSKAPLSITADNKAKVYGAADPALTATMSGFKYGDTPDAVQGLALSTATDRQAVAGTHTISAASASANNYNPFYVPGTLTVEKAVLTYIATPAIQFQDLPSRPLTGTVTGFVYGETVDTAATGTLAFTSVASPGSLPGRYGVQGGGLTAANYRFVQAAANDTALTWAVSPILDRPAIMRNISFESSSLYEKNFGTPRLCAGTGPLGMGTVGADSNDVLALEWSRVRVSPNLSNCLGLGQRNSCSDF